MITSFEMSRKVTHLNRSNVTIVATTPMRERTTPITVSTSNGRDGTQSWNLEQISWI